MPPNCSTVAAQIGTVAAFKSEYPAGFQSDILKQTTSCTGKKDPRENPEVSVSRARDGLLLSVHAIRRPQFAAYGTLKYQRPARRSVAGHRSGLNQPFRGLETTHKRDYRRGALASWCGRPGKSSCALAIKVRRAISAVFRDMRFLVIERGATNYEQKRVYPGPIARIFERIPKPFSSRTGRNS